MASIEKRGDSFRIVVSAGYDSRGRKIRKSITFRPDPLTATGKLKAGSVILKEAQAFADDFERQVLRGAAPSSADMNFAALADRYLDQYAFVELARGTAEGYRAILQNQIVPEFGHMKIRDLSHAQITIQAFYNHIASGKNGKRPAPASVRRSIAVFSSVMSWAVNMQLIPANPLERVRPPREGLKKDKTMSFSIEELKRFLAALNAPQVINYRAHSRKAASGSVCQVSDYQKNRFIPEQYRLFYVMAAFSGARRGELLALTWSDLDFESCTIRISKSLGKISSGLIVKETKTAGSVRTINMPASVMAQAKAWKAHQIELRLNVGSLWRGQDNIFCQSDGYYMYPDSVTARFRDIIRSHNACCRPGEELPEITLHGLRHTAASILIGQGGDIAAVSKRLGHSRTSVTLNIYTHAIESADKAASDLMDSLVNG